MLQLTVNDLVREAGVDEAFVHTLIALGAIHREGEGSYGSREVSRVRLLHAWAAAGLPPEGIMRSLEAGTLSLAFLDGPMYARPGEPDLTYRQLAADEDAAMPLVEAIHTALGFAPPAANDQARRDDAHLIELVRLFTSVGASEASTLRLLRVYADGLRRIAQAEVELYESEIEGRLRGSGMDERTLMEFGSDFGERALSALERTLLAVYRRLREHIWIDHSTNHAEVALDLAGIHPHVPRPHAICFVDLTGYTRITEERGDEVAARFAGELAVLVEDISSRRGGRPIRWLGDGGMFHFKEPREAVFAALDMTEGAPARGLPSTHIGIHTGPVIFQDGDVYGKTVNLASRIASHAGPGQVFVSEETVAAAHDDDLHFEARDSAELKGVPRPVAIFEASRVR